MCHHGRECRCPFCQPDSDQFVREMQGLLGAGEALFLGFVFLLVNGGVQTLVSADSDNPGLLAKAVGWTVGIATVFLLARVWR